MGREDGRRRRLLETAVCPHCWQTFPPEDAVWIAESPSLVGDLKLGETERERFLPTEYDERGFAVDAQGLSCHDMACPHCHLPIPAAAFEAPTIFMSIVGAPGSGKSYYLASSTWFLRKTLASRFKVDLVDADPQLNRRLHDYESAQFLSEPDRLVEIEKTPEQGDLYNSVKYDDQVVVYPQPFMFVASPSRDHPNADKSGKLSKTLCLYDNAGESYLPVKDSDTASTPVTRHLGKSECVFFLFDPTQDPRFRAKLGAYADAGRAAEFDAGRPRSNTRQETVFTETARRIRASRRMYPTERFDKLLVVIVTKLDEWRELLPSNEFKKDPVSGAYYQSREYSYLRLDKVQLMSNRVRALLLRYTPEFVTAAESFAEEVVYIPVSATGCAASRDPSTGRSGFRSGEIKPIWVTTPMLYALSRLTQGLVPAHTKEVGKPHS